MTVQQWSTTAADNNSSPPTGAPEGMAAAAVNNTMREMMASIAIEAQVNRVKYLNSVAGTNTITASMTPALTAYSAGMIVVFTPANTNTGATTLNINSLGALDVQKFGAEALAAGDLVAGIPAVLALDTGADDWVLLNPKFPQASGSPSQFGYRGVPRRTSSYDTGNCSAINAGLTIDTGIAAGHVFSFYNDSASSITLTEGSGLTLRLAGTTTTGNRTLAARGFATVWVNSSTEYIISGSGLS